MKIKKFILLTFILYFIMPVKSYAMTVGSSCSGSKTVNLGDTVSVTFTTTASSPTTFTLMIDYDSSILGIPTLSGNGVEGNAYKATSTGNDSTSKQFTYTFKTIATGTAKVKASRLQVADYDMDQDKDVYNSSSCTINVVKASSSSGGQSNNVVKNSDNNLKSLSVDKGTLSPEFNKDTLEYSVELASDVTKININAERNDSKASITGIGEVQVKEGQNKIEIVVTAENGSTKTYIINAYVKEKDPINVKVAGEKYTIVRNLNELTIPDDFKEVDVKINDEIIKGCYNEVSNITLVALKDSKGNINFYIYDLNKLIYTKYNSISSSNFNIVVIEPDKNVRIPHRYYKVEFDYQGQTLNGYTLGENSEFRIVYGINTSTGEKTFYQYDLVNNTIQRFYNEQVEIYVNLVKKCKLAFIILGSFIIILTIIIIVLLSKNVKFKNKYLSKKLNEIDSPKYNEVKYQDLEATGIIETKKTKKSKEKTFLDE